MLLSFELIFLLLVSVWGLEVIWKDDPDFDEDLIKGVNDGSINRVELRSNRLIFPGTLWCGAGNISTDIDDVEYYKDTDACCRTHDLCDDYIKAGETKYNLTNPTFNTRLNCKCDREFYDCLKEVNSFISRKIGFTYFTVLGTQCYRFDHPKTSCKVVRYRPFRRCMEYNYNRSLEKVHQWFDLPVF